MCFDCVERKRRANLPAFATAPRAFAAAPSFQACLHAFICTFCMCVCIYVYLCMCADMYICIYMCRHVYMYIYACVYVFVHLCVYTHVYVYVYAYLSIVCGSQYQCFSVWTVSCTCGQCLFHLTLWLLSSKLLFARLPRSNLDEPSTRHTLRSLRI